eukprot:m.407664 g.407664  ORF g.407664 m.407664 type:complete len:831 (-) comp21229_c0_seq1:35-2527(-)
MADEGEPAWAAPRVRAIAAHAYVYEGDAGHSGKRKFLSFVAGSRFLLMKRGTKDWWMAKNLDTSEKGYVPICFLQSDPGEDSQAIPSAPGNYEVHPTGTANQESQHLWNHDKITRQVTEQLLANEPGGTYLVRESLAKAGALSLSLKTAAGTCKHIKIGRDEAEGTYTLLGVSPVTATSLQALLEHYTTTPLSSSWGVLRQPCPHATERREPVHTSASHQQKRFSRSAPPPPTVLPTHQKQLPIPRTHAPAPPAHSATSGSGDGAPIDASIAVPQLQHAAGTSDNTNDASNTTQRSGYSETSVGASGGDSEHDGREASSMVLPAPATPTEVVTDADEELPPPVPETDYVPEQHSVQTQETKTANTARNIEAIHDTAQNMLMVTDEVPATDPVTDAVVVLERLSDTAVQLVRDVTGLSFDKSRNAVAVLVDYLATRASTPSVAREVVAIAEASEADDVDNTDTVRLELLMEDITAIVEDTQQRNWAAGSDDTNAIHAVLHEMLVLVRDADSKRVRHLVEAFQSVGRAGVYEIVETLVVYYQMETRAVLRDDLVKLFVCLTHNNPAVLPVLQNSVLPLELAREVMSGDVFDGARVDHIGEVLELLTAVVACGFSMPVTHADTLNGTFAAALVAVAEHDADTSHVEQRACDAAIDLLLAFNHAHFSADCARTGANFIMEEIGKVRCQSLSQRVLLLFNRSEDAVTGVAKANPTASQIQHSRVRKFLVDIFSYEPTAANFLYTSDRNVLVEVCLREITDRPHTDMVLIDYVNIICEIASGAEYQQDQHLHVAHELIESLDSLRTSLEDFMGDVALLARVNTALHYLHSAMASNA